MSGDGECCAPFRLVQFQAPRGRPETPPPPEEQPHPLPPRDEVEYESIDVSPIDAATKERTTRVKPRKLKAPKKSSGKTRNLVERYKWEIAGIFGKQPTIKQHQIALPPEFALALQQEVEHSDTGTEGSEGDSSPEGGTLLKRRLTELVDPEGEPLAFGPDGRLLTSDGTPLPVGANGKLLGSDGKPIPTGRDGRLIGPDGKPIPIGQDGRILGPNGKPLPVGPDGRLLGPDGKPYSIGPDGRLLDSDGNLLPVGSDGRVLDPEGLPLPIGADGRVLGLNGIPLPIGPDGRLLDPNGKPYAVGLGKKLFRMGPDGRLLQQDAQKDREKWIPEAELGKLDEATKLRLELEQAWFTMQTKRFLRPKHYVHDKPPSAILAKFRRKVKDLVETDEREEKIRPLMEVHGPIVGRAVWRGPEPGGWGCGCPGLPCICYHHTLLPAKPIPKAKAVKPGAATAAGEGGGEGLVWALLERRLQAEYALHRRLRELPPPPPKFIAEMRAPLFCVGLERCFAQRSMRSELLREAEQARRAAAGARCDPKCLRDCGNEYFSKLEAIREKTMNEYMPPEKPLPPLDPVRVCREKKAELRGPRTPPPPPPAAPCRGGVVRVFWSRAWPAWPFSRRPAPSRDRPPDGTGREHQSRLTAPTTPAVSTDPRERGASVAERCAFYTTLADSNNTPKRSKVLCAGIMLGPRMQCIAYVPNPTPGNQQPESTNPDPCYCGTGPLKMDAFQQTDYPFTAACIFPQTETLQKSGYGVTPPYIFAQMEALQQPELPVIVTCISPQMETVHQPDCICPAKEHRKMQIKLTDNEFAKCFKTEALQPFVSDITPYKRSQKSQSVTDTVTESLYEPSHSDIFRQPVPIIGPDQTSRNQTLQKSESVTASTKPLQNEASYQPLPIIGPVKRIQTMDFQELETATSSYIHSRPEHFQEPVPIIALDKLAQTKDLQKTESVITLAKPLQNESPQPVPIIGTAKRIKRTDLQNLNTATSSLQINSYKTEAFQQPMPIIINKSHHSKDLKCLKAPSSLTASYKYPQSDFFQQMAIISPDKRPQIKDLHKPESITASNRYLHTKAIEKIMPVIRPAKRFQTKDFFVFSSQTDDVQQAMPAIALDKSPQSKDLEKPDSVNFSAEPPQITGNLEQLVSATGPAKRTPKEDFHIPGLVMESSKYDQTEAFQQIVPVTVTAKRSQTKDFVNPESVTANPKHNQTKAFQELLPNLPSAELIQTKDHQKEESATVPEKYAETETLQTVPVVATTERPQTKDNEKPESDTDFLKHCQSEIFELPLAVISSTEFHETKDHQKLDSRAGNISNKDAEIQTFQQNVPINSSSEQNQTKDFEKPESAGKPESATVYSKNGQALAFQEPVPVISSTELIQTKDPQKPDSCTVSLKRNQTEAFKQPLSVLIPDRCPQKYLQNPGTNTAFKPATAPCKPIKINSSDEHPKIETAFPDTTPAILLHSVTDKRFQTEVFKEPVPIISSRELNQTDLQQPDSRTVLSKYTQIEAFQQTLSALFHDRFPQKYLQSTGTNTAFDHQTEVHSHSKNLSSSYCGYGTEASKINYSKQPEYQVTAPCKPDVKCLCHPYDEHRPDTAPCKPCKIKSLQKIECSCPPSDENPKTEVEFQDFTHGKLLQWATEKRSQTEDFQQPLPVIATAKCCQTEDIKISDSVNGFSKYYQTKAYQEPVPVISSIEPLQTKYNQIPNSALISSKPYQTDDFQQPMPVICPDIQSQKELQVPAPYKVTEPSKPHQSEVLPQPESLSSNSSCCCVDSSETEDSHTPEYPVTDLREHPLFKELKVEVPINSPPTKELEPLEREIPQRQEPPTTSAMPQTETHEQQETPATAPAKRPQIHNSPTQQSFVTRTYWFFRDRRTVASQTLGWGERPEPGTAERVLFERRAYTVCGDRVRIMPIDAPLFEPDIPHQWLPQNIVRRLACTATQLLQSALPYNRPALADIGSKRTQSTQYNYEEDSQSKPNILFVSSDFIVFKAEDKQFDRAEDSAGGGPGAGQGEGKVAGQGEGQRAEKEGGEVCNCVWERGDGPRRPAAAQSGKKEPRCVRAKKRAKLVLLSTKRKITGLIRVIKDDSEPTTYYDEHACYMKSHDPVSQKCWLCQATAKPACTCRVLSTGEVIRSEGCTEDKEDEEVIQIVTDLKLGSLGSDIDPLLAKLIQSEENNHFLLYPVYPKLNYSTTNLAAINLEKQLSVQLNKEEKDGRFKSGVYWGQVTQVNPTVTSTSHCIEIGEGTVGNSPQESLVYEKDSADEPAFTTAASESNGSGKAKFKTPPCACQQNGPNHSTADKPDAIAVASTANIVNQSEKAEADTRSCVCQLCAKSLAANQILENHKDQLHLSCFAPRVPDRKSTCGAVFVKRCRIKDKMAIEDQPSSKWLHKFTSRVSNYKSSNLNGHSRHVRQQIKACNCKKCFGMYSQGIICRQKVEDLLIEEDAKLNKLQDIPFYTANISIGHKNWGQVTQVRMGVTSNAPNADKKEVNTDTPRVAPAAVKKRCTKICQTCKEDQDETEVDTSTTSNIEESQPRCVCKPCAKRAAVEAAKRNEATTCAWKNRSTGIACDPCKEKNPCKCQTTPSGKQIKGDICMEIGKKRKKKKYRSAFEESYSLAKNVPLKVRPLSDWERPVAPCAWQDISNARYAKKCSICAIEKIPKPCDCKISFGKFRKGKSCRQKQKIKDPSKISDDYTLSTTNNNNYWEQTTQEEENDELAMEGQDGMQGLESSLKRMLATTQPCDCKMSFGKYQIGKICGQKIKELSSKYKASSSISHKNGDSTKQVILKEQNIEPGAKELARQEARGTERHPLLEARGAVTRDNYDHYSNADEKAATPSSYVDKFTAPLPICQLNTEDLSTADKRDAFSLFDWLVSWICNEKCSYCRKNSKRVQWQIPEISGGRQRVEGSRGESPGTHTPCNCKMTFFELQKDKVDRAKQKIRNLFSKHKLSAKKRKMLVKIKVKYQINKLLCRLGKTCTHCENTEHQDKLLEKNKLRKSELGAKCGVCKPKQKQVSAKKTVKIKIKFPNFKNLRRSDKPCTRCENTEHQNKLFEKNKLRQSEFDANCGICKPNHRELKINFVKTYIKRKNSNSIKALRKMDEIFNKQKFEDKIKKESLVKGNVIMSVATSDRIYQEEWIIVSGQSLVQKPFKAYRNTTINTTLSGNILRAPLESDLQPLALASVPYEGDIKENKYFKEINTVVCNNSTTSLSRVEVGTVTPLEPTDIRFCGFGNKAYEVELFYFKPTRHMSVKEECTVVQPNAHTEFGWLRGAAGGHALRVAGRCGC